MAVKDEVLIPKKGDQSIEGNVYPATDGRWNFGSLTARWHKIIAKILSVINIEYTGNLKPERDGTTYTGFVFVPLLDPLTHSSFGGASFSDVAALTKIENTSWSSTIPAEARALAIRMAIRDSGSSTVTSCAVRLYAYSTATQHGMEVQCAGINNDALASSHAIVPCTNGDIWYTVDATGTNTLDIWLRCTGYFI